MGLWFGLEKGLRSEVGPASELELRFGFGFEFGAGVGIRVRARVRTRDFLTFAIAPKVRDDTRQEKI